MIWHNKAYNSPIVARATGPGWIPARAISTGEHGVPQISLDSVIQNDLKDGVVLGLRLSSTTPKNGGKVAG